MPSVAVFGGGVEWVNHSALSWPSEGFDVEVFDLRSDYWGGKKRAATPRSDRGQEDSPTCRASMASVSSRASINTCPTQWVASPSPAMLTVC